MYASNRLSSLARRSPLWCASLAATSLTAIFAAPAQAQSLGPIVVTNVQIVNQLGTNFDPSQTPTLKTGGSKESVYLGNYNNTESELGLNYTGTADLDSFFFLHDNYCVGSCRTGSSTVIAFTIQNQGDVTQNVRFDSLITPGHIAQIYNGGNAEFNFQVLRFNDGFQTLYSASGGVNSDGIFLSTGNLEFRNQRRQTGENFDLLDWDTTALPVEVGALAGGQSTTIFYVASYFARTNSACADVLVCQGAQVVFGDPRNNGGTNLALGGDDLNAEIGRAVVGADYFATEVPFRFVNSNDPFSFETPPASQPLVYDPLYRSRLQGGVPEPTMWAMMIGGFGLLGSAARRRRVSVSFA
ncbi:PEP-CTERM sorting domain-containing protein [Sphingomonas sp. ID1715]|uniref:PEPxxWA-CTERM sorting domain-containing protein n=1 Tax=Sphingomonas sp. ID1715 TaxID=1656898 RepID=UPI001489CBA9|nr:PEPxxWA-CTERM sorting domain-containing protein [Sphingomonas sp. ID1715]NNM76323.1 PEP-CTERM sorting domain-containing protein [Sphingomonas sp. ID1715]